jgi:hypothetical protein
MTQQTKPPKWILWLFAVSLILWPTLMYWLANGYSGWSDLKSYYDAGSRELRHSQGPTNVTLAQASGRKYDFASNQSGRASYARTDVGFDDEGFWVRGRHGGWTGGPRGAIFIPLDGRRTLRWTAHPSELSAHGPDHSRSALT